MIKLPEGPTARFKLTNVVMPKKLHGHGRKTGHRPELILNNFSTRLGHRHIHDDLPLVVNALLTLLLLAQGGAIPRLPRPS